MPNSNKGLILLHKSGAVPVVEAQSIDVMLSPALYTLKQEALEIGFAHQAKKLAPAVLDELLDEGEYRYGAFKQNEVWVFVAYKPSQVMEALRRSGIEPSSVHKLYFAQQSAEMFATPIEVDAHTVLSLVGGVVTVMPKALLGQQRTLRFDESFHPRSGGVSLGADKSSLIATKEAIVLSIALVVWGVLFGIEGMGYSHQKSQQTHVIDEMLSQHTVLQSQYTRDSIAQKYRKRDTQERAKRRFLKEVSSVVRYGGVLQSLEIQGETFKAILEVKTPSSYNTIDASIKVKQLGNNQIQLEANA